MKDTTNNSKVVLLYDDRCIYIVDDILRAFNANSNTEFSPSARYDELKELHKYIKIYQKNGYNKFIIYFQIYENTHKKEENLSIMNEILNLKNDDILIIFGANEIDITSEKKYKKHFVTRDNNFRKTISKKIKSFIKKHT